jgi:hypothetical protein
MHDHHFGPGRDEPGNPVQIDDILNGLLVEHSVGRRRATYVQATEPPPCDGCGGEEDGVDLWAEDSETGEQLWLCQACGDS